MRRFSQAPDEEVKESTGKYKIDLLDGNDEEDQQDLSLNNDDGEDEDEKKIKANINLSKFENVFGIEGDESQQSANLRKSRDWFSKKSNSRIRTSIAGKFFQNKDSIIKRSPTQEYPS